MQNGNVGLTMVLVGQMMNLAGLQLSPLQRSRWLYDL